MGKLSVTLHFHEKDLVLAAFEHNLRYALVEWYERHQRVLPWRARYPEKSNPYYVFISEIMLQQTTVQTVIPYFYRFIGRFPNWKALAEASSDEVYVLWQGLGYYRRASNLHKAAKMIWHEYGGKLPQDVSELSKLPGIGDYTSKAIASIAFQKSEVPIDGNVIRVLSRVFGIETPLPALKKEILSHASKFKSDDKPGEFAQALMDLGATICKPKNPLCMKCPWADNCIARQKNIQNLLPIASPKKVLPTLFAKGYIYWAFKEGSLHINLIKRESSGIWANLYCFPMTGFVPSFSELPENTHGIPIKKHFSHTFTHFKLIVDIILIQQNDSGMYMLSLKDLDKVALPTFAKKVLSHLLTLPEWERKNVCDAA